MTERREIELAREELLQSERAARSAAENMARLKDEFLATLSHELRTPLTTILGWSELLLQRVDNTSPLQGPERDRQQRRCAEAADLDMLDLSSMLLGKVQLEVEVLDLRTVLGEAIGAQELVAEGKALDVHLQLPEQPSLVLGDATRLQQVFWNLLSNAIVHPAEGRIDLQLRADGNHWEITVRDTGDGIAPEFLNHLFSRFRQADGTTTGATVDWDWAWRSCSSWSNCMAARSPRPARGTAMALRSPCACRSTFPMPSGARCAK